MKELNLEQIERHLEGNLTKSEQSDFEQKMATDKAFAQEVKLFQSLIKGIDASGAVAFEKKVNSWEQAFKQGNNDNSVAKKPNRTLYYIIGIILLGIIAAGVWYISQPKAPQQELIFASNFQAYPSTAVRGENNSDFADGLNAYDSKNYTEAVAAFEDYLNDDEATDRLPAQFYLGISQLGADQPEAAISNFQAVIDAGYLSLEEAAQWYLALAYLKSEQYDNLQKQLDLIINTPQHAYTSKAEKLKSDTQDLTK